MAKLTAIALCALVAVCMIADVSARGYEIAIPRKWNPSYFIHPISI